MPKLPTAKDRTRTATSEKGAARRRKLKVKGVTVWAAFNPETGECMLPTVRGSKYGAAGERDRFYQECPIYQCWLSPNFLDDPMD